MGNILQFVARANRVTDDRSHVITKIVDGKTVECIDFEALSPTEISLLLTANSSSIDAR